MALLTARRPELSDEDMQKIVNKGIDSVIDKKAAMADAQALYDAGEKCVFFKYYVVSSQRVDLLKVDKNSGPNSSRLRGLRQCSNFGVL